ncbi:hypothetical protein DU508_23300 [Pedobacter chinensis]|uniref:Uncharacterized protein n=1 Tax=Pedobacter chinensis TaxID=2282421 RepID=A0A369PNB6_9SPHI|nr:hypothetical protein DU508_23300 [Pedobacter chinensis]
MRIIRELTTKPPLPTHYPSHPLLKKGGEFPSWRISTPYPPIGTFPLEGKGLVKGLVAKSALNPLATAKQRKL